MTGGPEGIPVPPVHDPVIGQWDFANLNIQAVFPDWRFFSNFALYLQPELWFATSDVQGETIFRMTVGLRVNLF